MAQKKKTPVKKKSPPQRNPASKGGNKMPDPTPSTQKPILKPVPVKGKKGPLSYCQCDKGKLVVKIRNHGGDMPSDPKFKVKVDFRQYGCEEKEVEGLKSGDETKQLEFNLDQKSFDPDCEFDIIIYIGEDLHRTTGGICAGGSTDTQNCSAT